MGDCFLTIGMFTILWSLGNLDYATVFSLAPYINENVITIVGICLLIGAMAKSSQVGLHVWLPMAMEGPTPVSALIHAATMVYNTTINNNNNNDNNKFDESDKSIYKGLNPYFVTGYVDGEGSFSVRLRKSAESRWGYKILPVFSIGGQINPYNRELLEKVKEFFGGVGWISTSGNMYTYEVTYLKSLHVIRNHFENYPLETSKYIHFILWSDIMNLLEKKKHYEYDGFIKILGIISVFPKGLSKSVLEAHSDVVPIKKPGHLPGKTLLNPYWIVGFVQADGTFGLNYIKSVRMKLGYTCQPQFRVTQHERDLLVLGRIIKTLGCGNIVKPSSGRDRYDISVANIKDLATIIIPFFSRIFFVWCEVPRFSGFFWRYLHNWKEKASYSGGFGSIKIINLQYEYIQKVLNFWWFFASYFKGLNIQCIAVSTCLLLLFNVVKVCRWLMWINQLLYRYMLGQLYNELIHIFAAMRYKMYKKILCHWPTFVGYWVVNQPVTLLSFINSGTSETACDITFIFKNYFHQKVLHKKINKKFLEWFIGFAEGKGSFIVLNNKVYFDINVSIRDIQVIYYIKKELGFGKVMIKNMDHNNSIGRTVSFYLTSEENFSRLVSIFNGNLCTVNKKQEFKNWLEIFNNQYSKDISFIDRVIRPSLTTGWLSGYIDALGSFIGLTENKELNAPNKTLYLTFSIYQKEFFILKDISGVLNVSIKNIRYNKDRNSY